MVIGGVTIDVTPLLPVLTGGVGVIPKISPTKSIADLMTPPIGVTWLANGEGRLTAAASPMMICWLAAEYRPYCGSLGPKSA